MSFGGPPPNTTPPSGPFEAIITNISSSPYTIAGAIFLMNMGGRLLPLELSKEQERFINQPMFRRFVFFVIFFVATRNLVSATWLAIVVVICIGYLFNENSSLCLFGTGGVASSTCKTKGAAETIALTPEEQQMLKVLTDKAEKTRKSAEVSFELASTNAPAIHKQYLRTLENLLIY